MNIQLDYHDRTVRYQIGDGRNAVSGEGIESLLAAAESSKEQIEEIRVSGETKSYTFVRQIYLAANLLSWLSGSKLIIGGRRVRGIAFPKYYIPPKAKS
jgi:hypothetical protein